MSPRLTKSSHLSGLKRLFKSKSSPAPESSQPKSTASSVNAREDRSTDDVLISDHSNLLSFTINTACDACIKLAQKAVDVDIRPYVWNLLHTVYCDASERTVHCCLLRAITDVDLGHSNPNNDSLTLRDDLRVTVFAENFQPGVPSTNRNEGEIRSSGNTVLSHANFTQSHGNTSIENYRVLSFNSVDHLWAKSALEECRAAHKNCGAAIPVSKPSTNILLIDTQRRCLVESSGDVDYFALSYVWGSSVQFRTTTQSLAQLMQDFALDHVVHLIPQVITDALKLVTLLGGRYFWADALCVCQDDGPQKQAQISQMAAIYASACMTIIALSGEDANDGLPGISPRSNSLPGCQVALGVYLAPRPYTLAGLIEGTKYHSRAWTYQEQLLSNRRLYFSTEQVYFQCGSGIRREDSVQTAPYTHDSLRTNPLTILDGFRKLAMAGKWDKVFKYYAQFIFDYTRKDMSFHSDAVNAVSGILDVLQTRLDLSFAEGLPIKLIDMALLWVPARDTVRVQTKNSGNTGTPVQDFFPSWSWAGWKGGAQYGIVMRHDIRSMIETVWIENESRVLDLSQRVKEVYWNEFATSSNPSHLSTDFTEIIQPITRTSGVPYILSFDACSVAASQFKSSGPCEEFRFVHGVEGHFNQRRSQFSEEREDQPGIPYCPIMDRRGVRCGLLYGSQVPNHVWNDSQHRLILLSVMTNRDDSIGYMFQFSKLFKGSSTCASKDETTKPWAILNVLLISIQNGVAERLAIGQLLADAWESARPTLMKIKLA